MENQYDQLVWTVVWTVLRKFDNPGIDKKDLYQEGNLALLKAQETYRAEKGVKFETYASKVIHNRLVDKIREYIAKPETEPDPESKPGPNAKITDPVKVHGLLEVLNIALTDCNEIEQKIFLDAQIRGYSCQEICDKYGVTKKKVDNTIQKIRKRARMIDADDRY